MFIDEALIDIKAGRGGDGAVSFRRERFVPRGGPDGGDGGNGGNIIFIGQHDLHTLSSFRSKKLFAAQDGQNGMHKKMHGKNGEDLIIPVPLGTLITFLLQSSPNLPKTIDITKDGQQFIAAKGGNGGWGNQHFATSIKQAPAWSKEGLPGDELEVKLELKLIADVGLVGLPNAGKSTFLSIISSAKPKIANYPFTTLEPNLGVVDYHDNSFVVADIPGLIEGASSGKGLGVKFLKHIQRTKLILYLIDASSNDYDKEIKILNSELRAFDPSLAKRTSLLVFNKIDVIGDKFIDIEKKYPGALLISCATKEGVSRLLQSIAEKLA